MASNAKIQARKAKNSRKRVDWLIRFQRDIEKIRSTGDTPTHYVGSGQPFTRGKPAGE